MSNNATSGAGGKGEPPGWYADPWGRAEQRWWNGFEWSDQTRAAPVQQLPAEGWYDDPDDGTVERWWDGRQWTDHTRPASESERALIEWEARRKDPKAGPVFADMDDPARWTQPATDSRSGEVNLMKILVGVVAVPLVVLILIGIVTGGGPSQTPSPSSEPSIAGSEYGAWTACKDFTERQLRAPSTADFPGRSQATITTRGDEWVVRAYVDAENGFGAMIRSDWRCTASKSGDTWRGSSTIVE